MRIRRRLKVRVTAQHWRAKISATGNVKMAAKPGLRTSAPRGASASSALYLYCITQPPTNKGTITVQAPGIDGDGRVESLLSGRFLCWVSHVSREEFATR